MDQGSFFSLATGKTSKSYLFKKTKAQNPEKKMSADDFNFIKVLGKGNYGKVMLSTKKDDREEIYYAVKVIKKSGLADEDALEHVLAENRVLQTLSHPYLVKLYYSFQSRVFYMLI